MWDNNRDHPAHQFKKLSAFFLALDKANKSGRGFRIAYTGDASPDNFELWSHGVWEILDGKKITYLLVEEYSDCCRGAGALSAGKDFYHRRLWTQSRKYGGIIHATSQRPQLISKDALGNAGQIWASSMDTRAAKRVGDEIDISAGALRDLQPGHFYHWRMGGDAQKIHVFTPN